MKSMLFAGGVLAIFAFSAHAPADALTCTPVTTAAELQAIGSNLAGDYCLKNDIDLGSIANSDPIGGTDPFTGVLDGRGFTIRNLKMNHADVIEVGLFGLLDGATIKNLILENVAVASTNSCGDLGALAGKAQGATRITEVRVGGQVAFNTDCGAVGGIVGWLNGASVIEKSSSAALIGTGPTNNVGGLVGTMDGTSIIRTSYATGLVFCGNEGVCGGLAGAAQGGTVTITKSFATGEIVCGTFSTCGGAIGFAAGNFSFIYASGPVLSGGNSTEGGLIGQLVADATTVDQSYSVGLVGGDETGSSFGGLIGVVNNMPTITNAYWDNDTSGHSNSAAGTGLRTTQFQKTMPGGFATTIWGITLKYSYPYLKAATPDFKPQLASNVTSNAVSTFVPISQLDKSNYKNDTNHIDEASLATCYTMIARAIGYGFDVSNLQDVKTDKYFWKDSSQKTFWRGTITAYAALGDFKPISAGASLKNNVVAEMKKKNVVLLHGTYQDGNKTAESWMLGTLFTSDEGGPPLEVFANDPFTGEQVQIDPTTKMVVSPKKFPLKNFTVDGYQPVTIGF